MWSRLANSAWVGDFLDEVAEQVDRAELGVGDVEAGRVREEVEDGVVPDRPGDGGSDRLQELIELPLMGAAGWHVGATEKGE